MTGTTAQGADVAEPKHKPATYADIEAPQNG